MTVRTRAAEIHGVSAAVLTLKAELAAGSMRELTTLALAGRDVRVMEGCDAVWVIVRRDGRGGVAFRASHVPGGSGRHRDACRPRQDRPDDRDGQRTGPP